MTDIIETAKTGLALGLAVLCFSIPGGVGIGIIVTIIRNAVRPKQ